MSLFKAREWWSAKSGSEELFDHGLLAVGELNKSASEGAMIVVGSFQGYLRIYEPHPPRFVASHVILEKELGVPIIQLRLGKFLLNSEQLCLCVLSPHRLALFTLSKDDVGGTHGIGGGEMEEGAESTYSLLPLYTHQLRRTAANMTTGFFEAQNGAEMVCVQSMDGQLSFFSPSSHSFSCFLPDFLLPGSLAYLPSTHTLLTCNSAHQLLFFRYQSLSVTGTHTDEAETGSRTTGNTAKKLAAERVVTLGEHVVQLQVVQDDNSSYIMVLGERSVYCLNQNGVVLFMKKLEVGASCLWAYQMLAPRDEAAARSSSVAVADSVKTVSSVSVSSVRSTSGSTASDLREKHTPSRSGKSGRDLALGVDKCGVGVVRSMLVTHSGQLLVMENDALIWTAALPHTPVHIMTANFSDLRGVLVSLSDEGHVTCSYLGTDPTLFTATPTTMRSHGSYEEMEKELVIINKAIKTSKSDLSVSLKDSVVLHISSVCDPNLVRVVQVDHSPEEDDQSQWEGQGEGQEEEEEEGRSNYKPLKKCLEVQVLVKVEGGGTVKDVVISVTTVLPLTTHPSHFKLPEVSSANPPDALLLTIVCTPSLLPSNTSLTLSATYTTQRDRVEVVDHEVRLPLQLFCEPTYPEKTGQHKVTVDAVPCEGNLSNLFPSVLVLPEAPPHALGLRYLCGPIVTVIASKTATQRYRLQSDSLPAIGVTLRWLLHRLHGYYRGRTPPFSAKFTPPLPLTEYFEIIEHHYKVRKDLQNCWEWLGRHAHQFRAIQKRLLTRFKDKTPVGLAHLDTLLDGTYMQLNALIDRSEEAELALQAATNHLTCSTLLILTLLKLAANLGEEDSAILTATFCPHVSMDTIDQGWAEQVDAGILHLLQTSLSKSSREQTSGSSHQVSGSAPLSLSSVPDCQKLKKHIALLCDRILKGYRPSGPRLEVTQSLSATKAGSGQEVAPVMVDVPPMMLDTPPVTASLSKDPLAAAPVNATAVYRKHQPAGQRRPSMPALQEHSGEAAS